MNERTLFLAATAITDPAARADYLQKECANDAALRQRIDALLKAHDEAGSFLEKPAADAGATGAYTRPADDDAKGHNEIGQPNLKDTTAEGPGTRIGPYKLLQQIGEGGMGVVYMAEQQEPVRRMVALKIIKAGMDSKEVVARFDAERQALAVMDHQNIAKVFDAGATSSGRLYFVMELVKGTPITKYCDEHRLTPRERLELFMPVCHALQHAHQKGIIHRDIKPSNVLVAPYDGKPVVKVIDFGIAKATGQRLTERTMFTEFGAVIGTLEYMSPEQAELNNQDIDTRSDIYSLGVLLYELLTGTTPLDRTRLKKAAFTEMLRIIREEEPPRPSMRLSGSNELPSISAQRQTEPAKLSKLVRGDLDWIVMKSLDKDRARRYETANGLARDIERYLRDEAVEASPPSAGYRMRKLMHRNKGPVTAAVLVFLALLAGVLAASWGMIQALREKEMAEEARRLEAEQRKVAVLNEEKANQLATSEKAARWLAEENERASKYQTQRAEYARHAIQMDLAMRAWEKHNVGEVERILDEVAAPFQQTWETRYIRELCRQKVQSRKIDMVGELAKLSQSEEDPPHVGASSFSKDWSLFACGHADKTVAVYDTTTGKRKLTLKGHTEAVIAVAFSPDNKLIASGSRDQTVRVWDAGTGREKASLMGHLGAVWTVTFSADGKRMVSGSADKTLKVWETETGKLLQDLTGHSGTVLSAAFSNDGALIASTATDNRLKVWETLPGREKLSIKAHVYDEYAAAVVSVAFSRDDSQIFTAAQDGVKSWSATTGKEGSRFAEGPLTSVTTQMVFDAHGDYLMLGYSDGTICQWDLWSFGVVKFELKGRRTPVRALAFGADRKLIFAIAEDNTLNTWSVGATQNRVFGGKKGGASIWSMSINRDSSVIAATDGLGRGSLWDSATGDQLLSFKGNYVALSGDGTRLVAASDVWHEGAVKDSIVNVWHTATGEILCTLKGHRGNGFDNAVKSVAFSPDGKLIATGGGDLKVRIWDAVSGEEKVTLDGHSRIPNVVVFSPDSSRILSATNSVIVSGNYVRGPICLWDATTGQSKLKSENLLPSANVWSVAFSADGRRIACGTWSNKLANHPILILDADSGVHLQTLSGHTEKVTSLAFSPDGLRLFSGSDDKSVRVWDLATGQLVVNMQAHVSGVTSLAVSEDGQRLFSASNDATVRMWESPLTIPK